MKHGINDIIKMNDVKKREKLLWDCYMQYFQIFITLIFPKQITDVICYGRHRDRENIKSKNILSYI